MAKQNSENLSSIFFNFLIFIVFKKHFYCWHYYTHRPFSLLWALPLSLCCSFLWPSPHYCLCSWAMHIYWAKPVTFFYPILPNSSPLTFSDCSMYPYLWFYFVHQFIWLIRFHILVRSYVLCLSLTGLFHLT